MVFKKDRSFCQWGLSVGQLDEWKADVKGAVERGYCHAEIWFDSVGEDKSELIAIGESQEDQEWAQTAIEYKKLANHYRKRAAVHTQLRDKASRHQRPVGIEAHEATARLFGDFHNRLISAINRKDKLSDEYLAQIKTEEDEAHKWACGQDGVNPPPPKQIWYASKKYRYLKAKDQSGFDRRPHELRVSGNYCLFLYHGKTAYGAHELYYSTDWNRAARGDWTPFRKLDGRDLGEGISGPLYIKKGDEITTFEVPESEFKFPNRDQFAGWLRVQKEASGLLWKELAKRLGLSQSTIYRYKTGRRYPGKKNRLKIGSFFE